MKTTASRRIASHYLYTPTGLLRKGVITLDGEGTITDIATDEKVDSREGVEFYSGILIPGMVNAHCHLELSYLEGAIARRGGFAGFGAGMRAARERFTQQERMDAAAYRDARMWADGVSAVADISNGEMTFGIKSKSPIHYHTFIEAYGLTAASAEQAAALCRKAGEMGLAASLTPHSIYSLNEKVFREALAGDGALSVHFMESAGEKELFDGRGELRQWYDKSGWETDFTDIYSSPAERIIRNIAPGRRVLLVHNTCIGADDARLLAAHFGDGLTWVVCPRSNDYITGAQPPIEALEATGARIAVGTDSLASNDRLSLIDELKMLPGVPLEKALRWATLSGAEALGVDDRLGSLEVGKRPGIVLLEGIDWDRMALTPLSSTRRIV